MKLWGHSSRGLKAITNSRKLVLASMLKALAIYVNNMEARRILRNLQKELDLSSRPVFTY